MESTRIDELVTQVVAWHNRHRLARRIAPDQVRSIGVVVLPFVAPTASESPTDPLTAAFSEDFIAPLKTRQVASFALRHGSRELPGAVDWPQRVVPADVAHESADLTVLYLCTASIELGNHRRRVLIGCGARPQTLGPRAWSAARIAGASAASTSVLAAAVMAVLLARTPEPPESLAHSVPAIEHRVASAEPIGTDAAPTPTTAPASAAPAPIVTPEKASEPSALAPAPAASSAGSISPEIRPVLAHDLRSTALLEGRRLRALAPETKVVAATHEAPRAYAVVTATARTRSAIERGHQVMGASALSGQLPGRPQRDLMQVADGWRAVLWPFNTRDEANMARTMLLQRGVRTEVLEF